MQIVVSYRSSGGKSPYLSYFVSITNASTRPVDVIKYPVLSTILKSNGTTFISNRNEAFATGSVCYLCDPAHIMVYPFETRPAHASLGTRHGWPRKSRTSVTFETPMLMSSSRIDKTFGSPDNRETLDATCGEAWHAGTLSRMKLFLHGFPSVNLLLWKHPVEHRAPY